MVEVLNGGMDGGVEMLDITEGALGQVVPLQVAPGALDVVQLGGVPEAASSTVSQGRAASALVLALLVWIGPLSSTSTTGRLARGGFGP